MSDPRVLLLMATHTYRAGAFLAAADRLGVPVAVGSDAEHVLAEFSPGRHLAVDWTDLEGSTDKIVHFAENHPLAAILAPEDEGVILAAMASDALELSHNRVGAVAAARNKLTMRNALATAGLPSPWYTDFSVEADPAQAAGQIQYPCVLKPLSLSASRGVIRADDQPAFVAAFRRLRSILEQPQVLEQQGHMARRILVEAYLPGDEVALEGILLGGQLKVFALFDKPDPLTGPYFEETIYVTPSRLPQKTQARIFEASAKGAAAIGIDSGPVHAELRIHEDEAWIIELAPRSIGGHCSRAVRFENEASLEEVILKHALGHDIVNLDREPEASGVMMVPIPHGGVFQSVQGQEEAAAVPYVEDILITAVPGQKLVPLPEGHQYLGFIFARAGTPALVEAALRAAHSRLQFIIQA